MSSSMNSGAWIAFGHAMRWIQKSWGRLPQEVSVLWCSPLGRKVTLKPAFCCFRSNKLFFIWKNRDRLIVWVLALHIYLDGGNSMFVYFQHPYSLGKMFHPFWHSHIFQAGVGEKPPTIDIFLFGWIFLEKRPVSIPNHPNHSIDSWRPVSRRIIARFSSCWKQRPGNFMGIYKHLEGQVKWRFQHFLLFFLMDGDSLGVVHWELSEWNRKGEIWKKTKEKTRKKHTKTKKMSEHVGKNAFHMSHKPICFSIDHLWRVLLHEGEALIVSQKKRTPKGCLVRGQLAQMTLCYIFGRSREYENSSGVSI